MTRSLRTLTVLSGVLVAFACGFEDCGYHDTWDGDFYLVGSDPLGKSDSGICARVVILNESHRGEESNNRENPQAKGYKSKAQWSTFSYDYQVCDGADVLDAGAEADAGVTPAGPAKPRRCDVHATAATELKSPQVPVEYGKGVTIKIPFDSKKSPNELKDPYFNLKLTIGVHAVSPTSGSDGTFQLGSGNARARLEGDTKAPEGVCGFEYRYRVRSDVKGKDGKPIPQYDNPMGDLTNEELKAAGTI